MRYLLYVDSVTVEITHKCNRGCFYCYNDSSANSQNEMPYDTFCDLIHSVSQLGVHKLYISGGEPLMHECAVACLHFLSTYDGEKTIITTGGNNFTDDVLNVICANNISVITTIDSPTFQIHDARRSGSFFHESVLGIKKLLERGWHDKYVIRFNLSYDNISMLDDMFVFCETLGVSKLVVGILLNLGRAKNKNVMSVETDLDAIRYVQKHIVELSSQSKSGLRASMDVNMPIACPYNKVLYGNRTAANINITPLGDVYSCSMMCKKQYALGNINTQPLSSILTDEAFVPLVKTLKTGLMNKEKCLNCKYSLLCHGGCPAYSLAKFNALDKDDNLCELRKSFIAETLKHMSFDSIRRITNMIAGLSSAKTDSKDY